MSAISRETVACVPRHIIRMRDKVDPDKLQLAYSQGREQGLRAVPALRELLAE